MIRDSIRNLFRVGAACSLLLLSACGALETAQTTELDSNTNWLQTCSDEAPCPGALSCLCGVCSHPCGTEAECSLLPGAECGPASCGGAGSFGGGMCVLPCAADSECSGSTVCEAGRCVAPADSEPSDSAPSGAATAPEGTSRWNWEARAGFEPCEGGSLTLDAILGWVRDDLAAIPASSRQYQRYVSLIDSHNAGVCEPELESERQALALALNSVSTRSALAVPTPIDRRNLVYRVDLRNYGWDRPVTVSGAVASDGWEALMDSLGVFAVEFTGPEADAVNDDTQSARPLAAAGSVVHAALAEPLYSALLGTPAQEAQLYQQLGVDVGANRESRVARRAGISQSAIATRMRLIERHPLPERPGALWLALTMAETQDPFIEPLQTSSVETQVAFSLPNGLLGYALFDAEGRRRTESSTIRDRASRRGFVARSGASCVGCHVEGARLANGEVRPFVLEYADEFDASTVEAVKQLYARQDELSRLLDRDRYAFANRLSLLGIRVPLRGEPRNSARSSDDYSEAGRTAGRFEGPLAPPELAAELWTSMQQLQQRDSELDPRLTRPVDRDPFRRLYFGALCTALGGARNRPRGCP